MPEVADYVYEMSRSALAGIGDDERPDIYVVDTSGAGFYWDHESELDQPDPEQPGPRPATLLTRPFAAFLHSLARDE